MTATVGVLRMTRAVSSVTALMERTRRGTWKMDLVSVLTFGQHLVTPPAMMGQLVLKAP